MDSPTRIALTPVAAALKPLLNRLVFHGIETCQELFDPTAARVRPSPHHVPTLHALATTAMERLTPELIAAGFIRTARRATAETWTHGQTVRLVIAAAAGNEPESSETIVGEYAVLLTRTIDFDDGYSVRVSNVAAQLALYWQAHLASRSAASESEWVEEMIELVMRRGEIVDDVRSAPAELRMIVAGAAKAFVASDSCRWILRRALPDARHTPAFVDHARDRFLQLAALA